MPAVGQIARIYFRFFTCKNCNVGAVLPTVGILVIIASQAGCI